MLKLQFFETLEWWPHGRDQTSNRDPGFLSKAHILTKVMVNTQEVVVPLKVVDWDVKPQNKQSNFATLLTVA